MTGRPATRTRGFGTRLVSGRSLVPLPASGTMTFTSHPPVAVFEPDHVVDLGGRSLEQVGRHHRLELVDHLGSDVECRSLRHRPLDQRLPLLYAQNDLAREHVDRFILLIVVLERQHVPGLDVQDLADIAVSSRPDQLVPPRLLYTVWQVSHLPLPPSADLPLQFRIPHSAFRTRSCGRWQAQPQRRRRSDASRDTYSTPNATFGPQHRMPARIHRQRPLPHGAGAGAHAAAHAL